MVAAAACVALRVTGVLAPELVERVYLPALFRPLVSALSGLSGLVPFSLTELSLLAGLAWLVVRLVRARVRRASARGVRPTWRARAARAAAVAAGGYLVFLLAWGLNYDRPPLARLLGLDARPAASDELAALALDLLVDTARERAGLPEDAAGALRLADGPQAALRRAPAGYARVERTQPLLAGPARVPKPLLSSRLFSRLGISGVYVPFSGEALVNVDVPASGLPFAACHELAHQRGFAREDEASFVGYLACRAHPDADYRYSAAFEALGDVLAALRPFAPQRAQALALQAARGVRRDWAAHSAWLQRHAGPARQLSHAVNDAYLRSQGQVDGVRSYGRVVDLLLAERRARGAAPRATAP